MADDDGGSAVKTGICRFFQTSKGCKFGDKCRFAHITEIRDAPMGVLRETDKLRHGNVKQLTPHNEENERLVEEKERDEQSQSSSGRQRIVCKFFKRKRGCFRGDECLFLHVMCDYEFLDKSREKTPNKGHLRPKTQRTHQRKEIVGRVTSNNHKTDQSADAVNLPLQSEREKQSPVQQSDILAQTNSRANGQRSGGTPSNKHQQAKFTENDESISQYEKAGMARSRDKENKGKFTIRKDKAKSVAKRVKQGKESLISTGDTTSKADKTVVGTPFSEEGFTTKITNSGHEDQLTVQKNNATKGTGNSAEGTQLPSQGNETKDDMYRGVVLVPTKERDTRASQEQEPKKSYIKNNASNIRGTYTLADAIFAEPKRLRSTEIQQLKRRFGDNNGYCEIRENSLYKVKFKPTDPDWPFKIEVVYLTVSFPDDYPLHIFSVWLSEEQDLPQDIISFVNQRLQQYTLEQEEIGKSQGNMKLYFRPFLRWFDKNVESFFVDAGKEMTKTFVSRIGGSDDLPSGIHANIPKLDSYNAVTGSTVSTQNLEDAERGCHWHDMDCQVLKVHVTQINDASDGMGMKEERQKQLDNDTDLNCSSTPLIGCDNSRAFISDKRDHELTHITNRLPTGDDAIFGIANNMVSSHVNYEQTCVDENTVQSSLPDSSDNDTVKTAERGTQIQFKGLHLEESISFLRGNKVVFTLECNRCKQRIDQQLSSSGSVVKQCTRCAFAFAVMYRPAVIHQFSSVLGYLDLEGCLPFDVVLPESELMLGCFHCSKETTVKGLQYGGNWSWCSHCHQKLRFQIQSTRFQHLQGGLSSEEVSLRKDTVSSISSQPKKTSRSSGVKEGQPLPGNGTCKHYKKSYRWLRFPCCGKCYPCDLCHEEEEDHEMKFATRMVCGFCSKEQPYSQQACSGCKASVTKSRSAHWEGGKGCRDKLAMSRNDNQKYSQVGKTTSRKAQKRAEGKGKRHKGK